jgi:hypothetical protein
MYCHFEGRIRKLESGPHNMENNKAKKEMPKQIIIVAFEIDKSKAPKRKAQTGMIWNCSKGVDNKNIFI